MIFWKDYMAFLLLMISHFVSAQNDTLIHTDWQLDLSKHQLTIPALGKKLFKDCRLIQLSYSPDLVNSNDFYQLGDDTFYLARQNAFRVNRRRFSGKILGYDAENDLRFRIDFRAGKLDGQYVVYKTNGVIETMVYQNNKLVQDVIRSKLEKMKGN